MKSFLTDESGSYVVIFAVALPAIVGLSAFGTEEGLLLYNRQQMQHAADEAARSAAVAYSNGVTTEDGITRQAAGVAALYGYTGDTKSKSTVTVNHPAKSGPNVGNPSTIEVIISRPQERIFSVLWDPKPIPISARSVALPQDQACILALNPTQNSSFSQQGSVNSHLIKCAVMVNSSSRTAMSIGGSASLSTSFVGVVGGISGVGNITTTDGTISGYHVVADPYADVGLPPFTGCDKRNYSTHATQTLNPGVYCGGIDLGAGANVTLAPGTYILDQGALSMAGSASLTGVGVTLVFTSSTGSNFATANITGGATINLVAPTSGPTAGIAIFGDRSMPQGTQFKFTGGNQQTIGGAVYLAKAALSWAGNATVSQRCTQIVADTIQMTGNSGLAIDCSGYGTAPIGSPATLLE
jgi:Flp pilus assembly protein TadG